MTSSPGFINTVWKVSESSSVALGTLYVFLSDGTLVVASPHGKPTLGKWKDEGGILTMVEEGIPYQVDVLNLERDQFKIRSHNPGNRRRLHSCRLRSLLARANEGEAGVCLRDAYSLTARNVHTRIRSAGRRARSIVT